MKSFTNTNFLLMVMFGFLLIAGTFSVGNFVLAQKTLDLKAPVGNEAFGGEQKGAVLIVPKEHSLNIVANMTTPPKKGTMFEGWLADVGGSDFKLSVGEFSKKGIFDYTATMVNPYTYTQFLVTEKPFEDPDPNAA